jgi:hypothetical protein
MTEEDTSVIVGYIRNCRTCEFRNELIASVLCNFLENQMYRVTVLEITFV